MSTEEKSNLSEGASQAILGPNPFIGFRAEDLLAAAGALTKEAVASPALVIEQQAALLRELTALIAGRSEAATPKDDKRFADPAWNDNPFYKFSLGAYLAWSNSLGEFVDKSSLDERGKKQAHFVTQLITDALSPSNTLANPAALKRAIDTGGTSLLDGLRNMISDVRDNGAMPSQVDKSAFEVGKNLATTDGSVVYRNDVLELIQYSAQTETTYAIPVLIVPPQINKYYVFDLSPEKSIVDFLAKGELRCFCISWRNPTPAQRDWGIDTYVSAIAEAIAVVREIAGTEKINVAGACAGGMTLSALLGYYAVEDENPLNSATLLVAVLDSQTESTIGLFASKESVTAAKAASARKGVLEGSDMGRIFAWLRPNDLVWNYWVNNYLMGRTPPAFDILYWNADTTRLPARFHGELIDAFMGNSFKKPGEVVVLGRPIDLSKVTADAYFVAGITDHITPWKGVYNTMQLFGGEKRMILSAAGHIQSLINPPAAAAKRQYYRNDDHLTDADTWLEGAVATKGSWWGDWLEWLQQRSGERAPAPTGNGSAAYPAIAPAPGSYVLE